MLRAEGFLEALEGDAPIEEREDRVGPIALGAVLGRGAFSSVLEGTWPDGRRCAVKRISKRCTKSRQEVRNVAAEHRALARLSGGPRCLELQGVLATERYVWERATGTPGSRRRLDTSRCGSRSRWRRCTFGQQHCAACGS